MTDKPTPIPTDAELKAMWQIHAADIGGIFSYALAVLAKWGTPAPVGVEPYGRITTHSVTGQQFFYRWPESPYLDNASECVSVYTTPQPTQAQPVAWEPEFDQFLSDVMTAAGLVTHGKQCKQLGERLGAAVMKLRAHGIKGGQHGTE